MSKDQEPTSVDSESIQRAACPLPWIHLSVALETALRVCCNTDHGGYVKRDDGKLVFLHEITSAKDYYNLESMKALRKDMLEGRRNSFCGNCYRVEDHGGTSLRQLYSWQFKKEFAAALERTEPDGHTEPKIHYMDFSLGNHCNLKCRMCSPLPSNALRRDFEEEGFAFDRLASDRARDLWKITPEFDSLVSSQINTVGEILTTGGEPFLSQQHRLVLQRALESGRAGEIILRYHTNLTTLPDDLLEAWKSFKRVDIHVSLEGYGVVNDYIRYPSNWSRLEANLDRLVGLRDRLPIAIEIHTCVQAYNFLVLVDLLAFLKKYEGSIGVMPYPILLAEPKHLKASVLPKNLRVLGARRLRDYFAEHREGLRAGAFGGQQSISMSNFESHIKAIETAPDDAELFGEFVAYTRALDRRRDQSLSGLIPEFQPYT